MEFMIVPKYISKCELYFQECIEHKLGTTKNWSYTQLHLLLNRYKLTDIAIKVDFQKSSMMKN